MNRDDFIDKILGGIFAVVAILAAVFELLLGGISASTIAACVKDVFGTLAVVVLFLAVIKDKIPKIGFEEKLKKAIKEWEKENENMIQRKPEHDIEHLGTPPSCYSLDLKTSVVDFYVSKTTTNNTGLFLRMPMLKKENYIKNGVELNFYMNKGTFFSNASDEVAKEGYPQLASLFSTLINDKHSNFAKATPLEKTIKVQIMNPIRSSIDIHNLIELINTVYTAYLVAANMDYKFVKGIQL